jgi:type I restriction enzyme, S subunit
VSIRGTVGRAAIVPTWAGGWNVAREVAVVPLLPKISRPLVHSYLLSREAQHFMVGQIRGAAQSGINLEDLRKLPIPGLSTAATERFEFASSNLDHIAAAQAESTGRLYELTQSLEQRAFQGEL